MIGILPTHTCRCCTKTTSGKDCGWQRVWLSIACLLLHIHFLVPSLVWVSLVLSLIGKEEVCNLSFPQLTPPCRGGRPLTTGKFGNNGMVGLLPCFIIGGAVSLPLAFTPWHRWLPNLSYDCSLTILLLCCLLFGYTDGAVSLPLAFTPLVR